MERRKQDKIPDLILTADWHLREDIPVCRTDDYETAQWRKVDFVSSLQKKYDCVVLHAGDLYDHWKPSPELLTKTLLHLPNRFYTIYGQHDLPQHNLELVHKCGINVLEAAGRLTVLPGLHWGQKNPDSGSLTIKGRKILVWHIMNYQGRLPYPECPAPISAALLRNNPKFDLILTGDNHKTFTEEFEGHRLVNPGAIMRMEADEFIHHPCVFLWYAEDNSIEQIFLPFEPDVISREHIEAKEQRDARIEAFVSSLDSDFQAAVSFKHNLIIFENLNKIRKSIMDIVYQSIEPIK
jgi:DNA repair exonuclease SbcCD nuclease subunit